MIAKPHKAASAQTRALFVKASIFRRRLILAAFLGLPGEPLVLEPRQALGRLAQTRLIQLSALIKGNGAASGAAALVFLSTLRFWNREEPG